MTDSRRKTIMKSQYRVCLCFCTAIGIVMGCSDAPKSPPSPETQSTKAANSKEAGGASTGTAKNEEATSANTGGPQLIPPSVDADLWPAVDPSTPTHAVTKEVEYYKTGPQQA